MILIKKILAALKDIGVFINTVENTYRLNKCLSRGGLFFEAIFRCGFSLSHICLRKQMSLEADFVVVSSIHDELQIRVLIGLLFSET